MNTQNKPVEWMISSGGIPVTLTYHDGRWCIERPQQAVPASLRFCPEGNEILQPLDEFLAEAEAALNLRPKRFSPDDWMAA